MVRREFLSLKTPDTSHINSISTHRITTNRSKMSNTTDQMLDIVEELESFLYTPYGLGTLAGVAILLTSLLWSLGCCIYCCCRSQHRRNEEGTQEAGRELHFIDAPAVVSQKEGNGTMSSGYNTGPASYSLTSLLASNNISNSSMDSIIRVET